MKSILKILIISLLIYGCKTEEKQEEKLQDSEAIQITPISHGTLVIEYKDMVIYVDPVGGAGSFSTQKEPTLIIITDIHGDHLSIETLEAITKSHTKIIGPTAVIDKLPETLMPHSSVLVNFESKGFTIGDVTISVEAIPMYNLREEAKQFHTKGRGNGYVITLAEERIYISGDTEDIPEMRQLKNIDKAFICMNLPWTMTVESAADAVLEFKPKVVYPYHYRGT
ncbi:MAG TPA: MBL fold metallo-hydrolase, partial [Christiangramia sp.]|nr:MBL fold metallo-hydrolase [Christiangramia sp.]